MAGPVASPAAGAVDDLATAGSGRRRPRPAMAASNANASTLTPISPSQIPTAAGIPDIMLEYVVFMVVSP
ncbi:hypothetical protein Vau01_008670 [Virgisporangium aurantiacum]|uniref:Uncharacterized protein n=1 Tax=Virgisporangium aurantiacum TaxID=175570 RepID=A0A8J4DXA1_9ACTN|nr:hypothetical protein Vau01_008670 [Virgisporangium aurantiacum]